MLCDARIAEFRARLAHHEETGEYPEAASDVATMLRAIEFQRVETRRLEELADAERGRADRLEALVHQDRQDLADAQKRADRLEAALRRLEWAQDTWDEEAGCTHPEGTCPACQAVQAEERGHEQDCWIAAALSPAPPVPATPPGLLSGQQTSDEEFRALAGAVQRPAPPAPAAPDLRGNRALDAATEMHFAEMALDRGDVRAIDRHQDRRLTVGERINLLVMEVRRLRAALDAGEVR